MLVGIHPRGRLVLDVGTRRQLSQSELHLLVVSLAALALRPGADAVVLPPMPHLKGMLYCILL